ncbi:MAG TPA: CDP-alcohol phosphatidyltransferase family protein [Bacteroidales bacterium]|nr:CDP-alcohol phosphatidyltransferase family protein [Bacteroidales bacterium]
MSWLKEYKSSLKMPEVEELLDVWIYRPLAFLLVKLIYPTAITPNNLTFFAIIMGAAGACFYFTGTPAGLQMGAAFYFLFNVFDCADGQLARLKKNGTAAGRIIDGIADYIVAVLIFSGLTLGYKGSQISNSDFIILIIISAVSIIFQEVLVDYHRTRFLDSVLSRQNTFNEGLQVFRDEYAMLSGVRGKWFDRAIIYIYIKYSYVQSRIVARNRFGRQIESSPEEYFKKNSLIMRFWVLMGPTAKISTMIICSLINRFDIYFWIVIGFFNLLAIILIVLQLGIDRKFNTGKA